METLFVSIDQPIEFSGDAQGSCVQSEYYYFFIKIEGTIMRIERFLILGPKNYFNLS